MPELKHIGPFVQMLWFDSWQMGDYIIALQYGFIGGGCITIYKGNELIRLWGTDGTRTVCLLYINYFIWAAEKDVVQSIPAKGFKIKLKREKSRYRKDGTVRKIDKSNWNKLFKDYDDWEQFAETLMPHFKKYVQEIDEDLINANIEEIKKYNLIRINEQLNGNK